MNFTLKRKKKERKVDVKEEKDDEKRQEKGFFLGICENLIFPFYECERVEEFSPRGRKYETVIIKIDTFPQEFNLKCASLRLYSISDRM